MKIKLILSLLTICFMLGCVGASSPGVFGTGVSIAMDPRTIGTQIDDSIMDKNLETRIIAMDKNFFLSVKTKVMDGRIFITGKVDTPEEKLKLTKLAWETKGARSVRNDLKIKEEFNFKQSAKDILITSQLSLRNICASRVDSVHVELSQSIPEYNNILGVSPALN